MFWIDYLLLSCESVWVISSFYVMSQWIKTDYFKSYDIDGKIFSLMLCFSFPVISGTKAIRGL